MKNRGKGNQNRFPNTEEKKIRSDFDEPVREDEVEFDIVEDDAERTTFLPMTSTPVSKKRKRDPTSA